MLNILAIATQWTCYSYLDPLYLNFSQIALNSANWKSKFACGLWWRVAIKYASVPALSLPYHTQHIQTGSISADIVDNVEVAVRSRDLSKWFPRVNSLWRFVLTRDLSVFLAIDQYSLVKGFVHIVSHVNWTKKKSSKNMVVHRSRSAW